MTSDCSLISELASAKDNIKRKYFKLKQGEADTQSFVSQTFKPIIDPLNKIQNDIYTPAAKDEIISKEDDEDYSSENVIYDTVDSWFNSKLIDRTYGPKRNYNGNIRLGNQDIKFVGNTLIIQDTTYPLTYGIISLIFSKQPKLYTDSDLEVYKSILIQTSAHLTTDGSKVKTGGNKYKDIIARLFSTGTGLSVKLQNHNIVYWNDPNELVDRLKLLLASQSAGNTSVSNEILSIFEELHEAGIINRMPNV
jgi:hypothetical protein